MRAENNPSYIKSRESDAITPETIDKLKKNLRKGDSIVLIEKEVAEDGSHCKIKRTKWQIVELYKHHMFLERIVKGFVIRRSIDYAGYLLMQKMCCGQKARIANTVKFLDL